MSGLDTGELFLSGYRMHEVDELSLPECKDSLRVGKSHVSLEENESSRPVLAASLPLCFKYSPPRPCPAHVPSAVEATIKRFGFKPSELNRRTKRRFKRFVQLWCKRNITPLTRTDIPEFEEWLQTTPYSESRREELRRVREKHPAWSRKVFKKVKTFIKDETYPEYKYPRLINSRVDAAKVHFGPVVAAISERLFSRPEFIKTVPVPQRPKVLRDTLLLDGADYVFTDYTSFEAHFTPEVMDMTQVVLFKHMLGGCDQKLLKEYIDTMTGQNVLQMKYITFCINACRMSGEMDTSLSNGFANLMLFNFCVSERGGTSIGFVEGDDGLFRVSPASAAPTKEDFSELGFTIKIEHTKILSEASFCGQVYDMEELRVVTDPVEAIGRLGWTNKKYTQSNRSTRMQLLRSRGYSFVYQYAGCPILEVLGRRILDLTEGVVIEERILAAMDQWERTKLREALRADLPAFVGAGPATRALVEKLYGVSIDEQLRLEHWFSSITLGIHECPFDNIHHHWRDYFDRYSMPFREVDLCWINRDQNKQIQRLRGYPCCAEFIASL